MKKLFFLLIVSLLATVIYSQDMANNLYPNEQAVYQIKISIGNEELGYPADYDTLGDDPGEYLGTRCPALMRYVNNKEKYIGGKLYDQTNNKSTVITDIKVELFDNYSLFTVYGKDFNCYLTTSDGYILDVDDTSVLFANTEKKNVFIWKITKK